MDSRAQASTEYLFAIVLSFFLTLIILSTMVNFAGTVKESINCKINQCAPVQANAGEKAPVSINTVMFAVTLVVFYFVEFFFVIFFLKYLGKPEKKKPPKKSNY